MQDLCQTPRDPNFVQTEKVKALEMLHAIERIDELSESGTQHSGRPSRLPSQLHPKIAETLWPNNPLADPAQKSTLLSQRSDRVQLQADKYRSGETRKVSRSSKQKILSVVQEMQAKQLFAQPAFTFLMDFTYVRKALFMHRGDELQVFDSIQREVVERL